MDISANPANQVAEAEMTDIDQFRPATSSRVEPGSLETTAEIKEEMDDDEDWSDIYGTNAQEQENKTRPSAGEQQANLAPLPKTEGDVAMGASEGAGTLPLAAPGEHQDAKPSAVNHSADDDLTARMADAGEDDLVDESKAQIGGVDEPSSRMIQETSELEQQPGTLPDSERMQDSEVPTVQTHTQIKTETKSQEDASANAEYVAAAKELKGNPEAEFEYDSDSDSSDSSSDSSSEDDSDDDDAIEPMDAETLGKILMAEDGGDDVGKTGAHHQPRTQNEMEATLPEKPDIVITPDMKITHLGQIEHFVDNIAVIRGNTGAHDEVMDEAVLCNDQRTVIGAVSEPIGSVDEPRYLCLFSSPEEFEALGLKPGSNVHYVNSHSKTAFTKGLRGKGTDASNIHDEEVGEDEEDFSDDEKEAEYKRKNKESKKAGRGALSRSAFNREQTQNEQESPQSRDNTEHAGRGGRGGRGGRARGGAKFARGAPGGAAHSAYDKPQSDFPATLNYDDDDDGAYTPLKRPDNMAQMQQMGGPPRGNAQRGSGNERGRGGNRGGRGDGGRGKGDRVGRGGSNMNHSNNKPQQTHQAPAANQAPQPQAPQGFEQHLSQAQYHQTPAAPQAPQAQVPQGFGQLMGQAQPPQAQNPYIQNYGQTQQPFAQPQQAWPMPYAPQNFQQPYQQNYQQPAPYQPYAQMPQQQYAQAAPAQHQAPAQTQTQMPAQAQAPPASAEQWAHFAQTNPDMAAQMYALFQMQQQQQGGS